MIYKGKAKVENVVGEVYTGTLNIFQLMNTIDFDVNVYGLHIIKNGTNIKISGTSTSSGAFSFSKGAALSTSEMRNQGGGYALPNDYSYIFKLFVEKENFQGLRPSFSIINNSSGTIADVNTSNIESLPIAYNESWGQIYWWIPSDCTFDCEYEFGLFVSDFNSLYRTEKTSKVRRIIADGTYEIGELTLGNCDIYKTEVWSEKNRNDCLPLDYGSKIVWFGDSISQLQHLPHRVGENIRATVYDCSFAGSTLAYDSPRDTGITILALSSMIVSGDFSDLDATLNQQEADGRDVTEKRINASTLKSIDFNDIDSIVVMSGTNEMNNDYTYDAGLVKFKNAMDTAIKNIVITYPHIRMYFISNPYRGDYTPEKPDKFGMSLVDYIEAEKEVCYANNIPFYDLYHSSGINASTVSYYMNSDLLHQNENGDILLAEKCAKWLMSN